MKLIKRRYKIYLLIFLMVFFFISFLATKLALAAGAPTPKPTVIRQPVGSYGVPGVYGVYGQYGTPPTSTKILIDKFVGLTTKGISKCEDPNISFVDNFNSSDVKLRTNQEICFKLKVTNTSTSVISKAQVSDFIPQFLDPIEGPGNFDNTTRTINFDINNLNPAEARIFFIKMQVVSQDKLPKDVGFFCMQNRSVILSADISDEDTAQVCIER